MSKMVTRTFTGYNVTFLTGVNPDGSQQTTTRYVDGTPKTKERAIRKVITEMAGTGILLNVEYVEEIRGVDVDTFFRLSVPVERPESQRKRVAVEE